MQHAIVNAQGKYLSPFGWAQKAHAAMVFRTKEDAEQHAATLPHSTLKAVPVIEATPGAPPEGTTQIFGIKAKANV